MPRGYCRDPERASETERLLNTVRPGILGLDDGRSSNEQFFWCWSASECRPLQETNRRESSRGEILERVAGNGNKERRNF
jgi:hypothetical protein